VRSFGAFADAFHAELAQRRRYLCPQPWYSVQLEKGAARPTILIGQLLRFVAAIFRFHITLYSTARGHARGRHQDGANINWRRAGRSLVIATL
jgi:hypothetical protein